MALKTVDLTKQPCRALFTGCSQEEVSYAKTFWQSIQLLPPMESRLVSSDIKQRLRKAPPSRSLSNYTSRRTHSGESHLQQFFVRAKTMENIEEYRRLRMLASAREEDRDLLHKHRAQRIKKEEISRRVDESSGSSTSQFLPPMSGLSAYTKEVSEEEQMLDEMWPTDVKEEISKFEKMKKLEEPHSEDEQ